MQSRDGDETLEGGHPAQNYHSFQAGGWGGGSLCAPETEKSCGAMGRLLYEHIIVSAIRIHQ